MILTLTTIIVESDMDVGDIVGVIDAVVSVASLV